MAKVIRTTIATNPVLVDTIFHPISRPADIVLTSTQIEVIGSKIKIFGATKNLLATFDSKTSTFTVHKKLVVGKTDVLEKLKTLEARIQKLEP